MSMTFAINPETGDLQINSRKTLQHVYGSEEVRQRILIALQHYYQEYFLNIPAGVPWYELILGSKDKKLAEALIRRTILSVPNVISIINFQMVGSNRSVSLSTDVQVSGIDGSTYIVAIALNK